MAIGWVHELRPSIPSGAWIGCTAAGGRWVWRLERLRRTARNCGAAAVLLRICR
jgi:hypothetical protein